MIKKSFIHFSILTFVFTFILISTNFAQGFVCAIGGGSENYNDWSDAPYRWIVQKADSGKIIIIDVADASNWLPNYFVSLGATQAYNKTIPNLSAANLQSTYDELITAKGIFIRGGNQWDYIRFWKGTKVDSAIQYVFNNGGVIAGTSAGAAILGEIDFTAQSGTIYPDEALQNPFSSLMRFEDNFLKLVRNVLFDTHFIERGRHGRLIGMIYNRHFNTGRDIIGVGIDDRTAICISPDGIGEVMGSGAVTIYYKDNLTKYSPYNSGKYTIENLKSHILTRGWKFNFNNKTISFIPSSAKEFDANRAYQFPKTDFYLTGNNNISANISSNLSSFLSSVNSNNVLIISHPGFSNSVSTIISYLSSNNYNYSTLYLTSNNLNDQIEANKISSSSCIVFVGDSLNVLSFLNQAGTLVSNAFLSFLQSNKPIFFFGNVGKIVGERYVANTDSDMYASYRGRMTLNDGINVFGDLIFQPLVFDNADYYENRMSSVLWGMMRSRKLFGIYLNGTNRIQILSSDKSISGNTTIPFIIVDAREATKVDSSVYRASGSIGPRQVVAFDKLRWSLTNYSQIKYLLDFGRFDFLTAIDKNETDSEIIDDFTLEQNYPNPFNQTTTIRFKVTSGSFSDKKIESNQTQKFVSLKIYDILGNEVANLLNEYKSDGIYEVKFDAADLTSGVYLYKLKVGDQFKAKKMIYLK
ncbi:MAG: Type 1 glutamine amidotransferase-like domain-containing protein [Ignavibacterium sp.]|nr:Type 1 glutamine amidotransferase-like domain-containing protein [Ignavibacterium sp.]